MFNQQSASWTPGQIPDLTGTRFLITGANSGIGYFTALELARHGATVVMACRDRDRGEAALARLRREAAGPGSGAPSAELHWLDLASLRSVRDLVETELAGNQPLHGLINNAGVMAPPKRRETGEGFELQFGTNVLGHFALTLGLLPAIERGRSSNLSDAPRIVTLASMAHRRGIIRFDDLQSRRRYNPIAAYAQSKLADLLFAVELERRLRANGSGAISVAAHPGVADTNLFKQPGSPAFETAMRKLAGRAIGLFLNSERAGALPTLYAATANGVVGGGYYGPQRLFEMRGSTVGLAKVSPQARNPETARRLWSICEELTGLHYPVD